MRTFTEKLSQSQVTKIKNELDFFKEKGFEVKEERELPKSFGNSTDKSMKYVLNDNKGIEVTIIYDLFYSGTLRSKYSLWIDKFNFYYREGIKSFKEFRKVFEK